MADLNALGNTANFSVSKGGQLAPEYPFTEQNENEDHGILIGQQ